MPAKAPRNLQRAHRSPFICQADAYEVVDGGNRAPARHERGRLRKGLKNAIESTVRYLGIEVDDALAIAEQVDVKFLGRADMLCPTFFGRVVPTADMHSRLAQRLQKTSDAQRTQMIAGQMMADLGGAMQHKQQSEQARRPSGARTSPRRPPY